MTLPHTIFPSFKGVLLAYFSKAFVQYSDKATLALQINTYDLDHKTGSSYAEKIVP